MKQIAQVEIISANYLDVFKSYTASKMIEGKHEVLIVWSGWNQKGEGRVVNNGEITVVYMEVPYPALIPNWTPIEQPPTGGKPQRLVLVRRSSDEILMGRWTGTKWICYFNNTNGVQAQDADEKNDLRFDPIVDWQELPITQQQFELKCGGKNV